MREWTGPAGHMADVMGLHYNPPPQIAKGNRWSDGPIGFYLRAPQHTGDQGLRPVSAQRAGVQPLTFEQARQVAQFYDGFVDWRVPTGTRQVNSPSCLAWVDAIIADLKKAAEHAVDVARGDLRTVRDFADEVAAAPTGRGPEPQGKPEGSVPF